MGAAGTFRGGRRAEWFATLAVLAIAWMPSSLIAAVTIVGAFPVPQLILVVGSSGASISKVTMTVPGSMVGNGTPIDGIGNIRMIIVARGFTGPPDFELTADSSTPLSNGAGAFIPMTAIDWLSADGDFASPDRFDGTSSQLLLSAPANRVIVDFIRYRYRNVGTPPAGTYTGRVRFTLAVP